MLRSLSIDVGTSVGWAAEPGRYGSADLSPRPGEADEMRFVRLRGLLKSLLLGMGGVADLVLAEGSAGFIRGQNAVRLAHEYRGVIRLFCGERGIPYFEVAPSSLKRFATGHGAVPKELKGKVTSKQMMVEAARTRLGYKGRSDDEADALWLREAARAYGALWLRAGKRVARAPGGKG